MSVVGVGTIAPRMWRGYDDPGLPAGAYIASGFVLGDGSGGVVEVTFPFKPAGQASSARFYNIEQLSALYTITAQGVRGYIRSVGFEDIATISSPEQQFAYAMPTSLPAAIAAADIQQQLPIFLGQSVRFFAGNSRVDIGTANAGIVTILTVTMQGYVWDTRSIMAPGGLRRPVEGLYGR